jgi:hypothetical protein
MNANTENAAGAGLTVPSIGDIVGVARAAVHLGLGLAAMALDEVQRIGREAVARGATVEREGLARAAELERDTVAHMKGYIRRSRESAQPSQGQIEAQVEQALATFDVPTREDIRQLHHHLAAIGEKLNHIQTS